MKKLIQLEVNHTNIKPYLIVTSVITLFTFSMLYMFAIISRTSSEGEFFNYKEIIIVSILLNMCFFCVLGSSIYSHFVVEEYTGKRALLLFSYPIDRKKMFYSKILLVTIFTSGGMFLSNIIIFSIFFLSETIVPIVNDNLSTIIILKTLFITILMCVVTGGGSLISVTVGLWRKSVPVTIITAVLFCATVSNIITLSLSTLIPIVTIAVLMAIASLVIIKILSNNIDDLEV